ncbi:hypothetical protein B0T26DRAFT_650453 [Lasiosphaeria miniovina]|uniref:Uncharacterized protein n=1 Tax=Lasiosphaeria miniovina TaxID=1954250 RepID=A0AA40DTK6_9PEZI|nr:uncharacterized protein B0T26DRAFT_650453 [Lasiosphaeria miniovina]KAK0712852.1 hypothetical protein B0T26DRAFT_650453 [Lasiosphaeria miniovina]
MCTLGYNYFSCGCKKVIDGTLTRCAYASIKGMDCPDFQLVADAGASKDHMFACMSHS